MEEKFEYMREIAKANTGIRRLRRKIGRTHHAGVEQQADNTQRDAMRGGEGLLR